MTLTPRQHRAEVLAITTIGMRPTARQIRQAYRRYLVRRVLGITS